MSRTLTIVFPNVKSHHPIYMHLAKAHHRLHNDPSVLYSLYGRFSRSVHHLSHHLITTLHAISSQHVGANYLFREAAVGDGSREEATSQQRPRESRLSNTPSCTTGLPGSMAVVRLWHSCYDSFLKLEQARVSRTWPTHPPKANECHSYKYIATNIGTNKHMQQPHSPS